MEIREKKYSAVFNKDVNFPAPKLNGLPAIGQLVAAKFTDDNYYRAIVTKIENDKINVSYVDYGNCEVTSLDQLRGLSDELKQVRNFFFFFLFN